MPILKKGEIKVRATAYGTEVKSTGYVFYSYDKNSSALFFQFRNQNGEPTDIANAKIHLLMVLEDDEGKEFIPGQEDFEIISKPGGKAKFVLPEMLLAYQGKVTGYIYLDFEDGSQTDEGQFTFRIRRSMITHVLPAMGDKYVQDFEDVKERVEQAGDSATKDIEKAKDNAESQIGDYVGEIESAKQDISSIASDVQSKASEANEDIDDLVKTTEDARDEAVKSMNEIDYSDRNLLVTSKLIYSKGYTSEPKVEDNGRKISVEYKENSKGGVALGFDGWKPTEGKYTLSGRIEINGEPITQETFPIKRIHTYHHGADIKRFEILSDGTIIATERFAESINRFFLQTQFEGLSDGDIITFYDLQFQRGSVPTPWQPAMGDYDAKIKRLENAITNLGGSL